MILSLFSLALGLFLNWIVDMSPQYESNKDFISYIFIILGIIGVIWHFYKKPNK